MARVPTVSQVSVEPSAGPLRVSAPPGAFGPIGDILQAGGKTAQAASDAMAEHAEKIAAIDNRLSADSAAFDTAKRIDARILDFQTNHQGRNAEGELPNVLKDIESIRTEGGAHLVAPNARDLYNSQTRITAFQAASNASSFASREKLDYLNKEAEAGVNLTANSLTAENFGIGAAAVGAKAQTLAALNGWGEDTAKAYIQSKLAGAAYNITVGMAASEPAKAQAFYDQHKALMAPGQREQAENLIRTSSENFLVKNVADEYTVSAAAAGGYAGAIAAIESRGQPNGGYQTQGKVTRTGDRAYGRYGIMGANVGPWTQEVLGRRMTPQAFLADPQAQDRVFNAKFGQFVEKYGSPEEAASVWFTGKPIAQGANLRDVNGMSGAEYVANFRTNLGGDRLDRMETNAPEAYAAIANDPRLKGRPDLINQAQSGFLTNISQARTLNNLQTGAAMERLLGAAAQGNITDVAQLQQAYPQALDDYAALSEKGKRTLQATLNTQANTITPTRYANAMMLKGMWGANEQQFVQQNLNDYDLTRSDRTALYNLQVSIHHRAQKQQFQQVALSKALANEMVVSAFTRAGIKKDTPAWYQFTGSMLGELGDWADSHPGKKPTDHDYQAMAAHVLAQSNRANVTRFLGVEVGREPLARYQTAEDYTQGERPHDARMAAAYDLFVNHPSNPAHQPPTPEQLSELLYRTQR